MRDGVRRHVTRIDGFTCRSQWRGIARSAAVKRTCALPLQRAFPLWTGHVWTGLGAVGNKQSGLPLHQLWRGVQRRAEISRPRVLRDRGAGTNRHQTGECGHYARSWRCHNPAPVLRCLARIRIRLARIAGIGGPGDSALLTRSPQTYRALAHIRRMIYEPVACVTRQLSCSSKCPLPRSTAIRRSSGASCCWCCAGTLALPRNAGLLPSVHDPSPSSRRGPSMVRRYA